MSARVVRTAGETIGGRFVLEGRPIQGGMGCVWRAKDTVTHCPVAVKFVIDIDEGEATLRRFHREIRTLRLLRHPHIVEYIDHGVDETGSPYLAMEWLDGSDLGGVLKQGPMRIDSVLRLGRRVASALAAAHERGIVHRDIKPSNLHVVGGDVDRVKVLDFGIATSATTLTALNIGTPGYMAPEQIESPDEQAIDARADVFSLGVVLHECLTGQRVFTGPLAAVLAKILFVTPPRVAELRPDVPPWLSDLVARMLEKQRENRPSSGAEVAAALEHIRIGHASTMPPSVPRFEDVRTVTPIAPPPSGQRPRSLFVVAVKLLPTSPSGASESPTLRSTQGVPPDVLAELRAELDAAHAASGDQGSERLRELPGASFVILVQGGDNVTANARRAVQRALLVKAKLPAAFVAVAAAPADGTDEPRIDLVLDAAFRSVDLAGPDETEGRPVRVDDLTTLLAASHFQVEKHAGQWVVLGEREGGVTDGAFLGEAPPILLGKRCPFVGRHEELRAACAYVEEAFQNRRPKVVCVLGEEGAGASRLRFELVAKLLARPRGAEVLVVHGDPLLRVTSAFSTLGAALRAAAGISFGEALETNQKKLAAFVDRFPIGSGDTRRAQRFLGELVRIPFPDEKAADLRAARKDAALMAALIQEAFVQFIQGITKTKPLTLVLDDVEGTDPASLALIDAALGVLSCEPFVVLALARPDIRERSPGLWAGRDVAYVRLGKLDDEAAAQLVRDAAGERLAEDVTRRIVARAGGNPLFLEELVRAAVEGRGDALPETALDAVSAGLDAALDDETRRVLGAASIFGETSWEGGIAAVLGEAPQTLGEILASLCDREILVRRGPSRFADQVEYTFRHPLLREAARRKYAGVDPSLDHRRAAEWLLDAGERDSGVLALHFERGGDAARAAAFLRRAAERALFGGALDAAVELATRALDRDEGGEAAAELWVIIAEAQSARSRHARACEAARCALPYATPGSRSLARALDAAIRGALAQGDTQGSAELLQRLLHERPEPDAVFALSRAFSVTVDALLDHDPIAALPYFERMRRVAALAAQREPEVSAWWFHVHARWARVVDLDPWSALEFDRRSLVRFDVINDRRYVPYARLHEGLDLMLLGAYERAYDELREGLRDQPEGSPTSMAGHTFLALLNLERGAFLPAVELAEDVIRTAESQGERLAARRAQMLAVRARIALGELDDADRRLGALRAASTPPGALLGVRAAFFLAAKEPQKTLILIERALALRPHRDGRLAPAPPELLLLRIEALRALGAHDEARAAVADALAEIEARAAKIPEDDLRQSFLERRAVNARLLGLSRE